MPNNDTPSQNNQSSGTGKIKGNVHGFVSGSSPSPSTTQPFSGQGHRLGGEQKTPQELRDARLKRFEPKASTENTGQAALPRAAGFAPVFTETLNTLMQKKIDAQNKSAAKPVVTAKVKPASPGPVAKPKGPAKSQEPSRLSKMAAQFKDFFSKKPPSAEQQIKEYRQKQATKFAIQQKAQVVDLAAKSTGLFPQIASWVKEGLSYLAQKKNNEGNTQAAHVSAQNDVTFVTTEEDVATLLSQFENLPIATYDASELEQTMPTTPSMPEESQLQTLIILFIQIMMALKAMMQQQQQQMHQNGQGMQINPLAVLNTCSQLLGMQLGQPLQQGAGSTNINIVVGNGNNLVVGQENNDSTSGISPRSGVNVNIVAGDNNQGLASQRNGSTFDFSRNDTPAAEIKHELDKASQRHLPRGSQ